MNIPKVSVIIPVYNAENYLERCLESVVNQTLKEIEIICIDDGSSDKSKEIIQRFSQKDKRIKGIYQENQGAAIARNKGIEVAVGEYIGFVDSDDFVDATYFKSLYQAATDNSADIARAYIKTEIGVKGTLGRAEGEYEDYFYNEILKKDILSNKLNQRYVVWLAIYRRRMLEKNKITFPADIRTGQDVLFNIKTGYYANRIVYTEDRVFYHRSVREGSLMTEYIYSDKGLISRSLSVLENVRFLNSKRNYDKAIYISHMLDALNFIRERASYSEEAGAAREIARNITTAWSLIRYKNDLYQHIKNEDRAFADVLGNEEKFFAYLRKISAIFRDMPSVSVILPVFNQQKHLDSCLKSILSQTIKDIEIICVNDGSTDGSQNILERYSYRDRRIQVINKENGGVSTARNAGFEVARGKYVIFLDSDDFFDPSLLEKLYKRLENTQADIAVCNFKVYYESMQKYSDPRIDFSPFKTKTVSYETNPDGIFDGLTLMFWNKMFRRDFLVKTKIRNDETLHRAQDIDFIGRALVSTKKIVIVNDSLIHYRTDVSDSNVRQLYKHPYDVLKALEKFKAFLDEKNLYGKTKKSYIKIAVDHILANLYFTETYPVHKQIYSRAKQLLSTLDIEELKQSSFSNEKAYGEAKTLLDGNYEEWLRYRITDLRDDKEAKYISYLLEEYKRKYDDEMRRRSEIESNPIWKTMRLANRVRRKIIKEIGL